MPDAIKYVIDAAVGFALFMALMVVFVVDRFLLSDTNQPSANTLLVNVIDVKHREAKKLRLAVTPTHSEPPDPFTKKIQKWDDMGKLLNELGSGYRYEDLTMQDIVANPKKLNDYDVVFLTCAPGGEEEMKDALRNYVAGGGILYASDWRYDAVARAFPDLVAPNLVGEGIKQEVEADIVDRSLSEALKSKKLYLKFDLPRWKTAAFGGPRVHVLLQGTYANQKPPHQPTTAPLMVKMKFKEGIIIFTSFHNESQNSEMEKKLLQYLVFSLVNAGVDADVNAKMEKGGFTPQRSNLLSTPERNQSISKTYEAKHPSELRFAFGFRNDGAKLRFHIKSPDGKEFTKDCESAQIFEVPNAMPGTWTYTVTNLHLPYDNFPFTVTVGEKK